MEKSTVYIDESGDLGYGKGTRWFVITAVIVDKDKESLIRKTIKEIKERIKISDIHFRKISDFNKKFFLVNELNKEDFIYINIIADTNKMDYLKIKSPTIAYNYMCRILLERVSWFLRDTERIADIVLSARGSSKDGELIKYVEDKLIPFDNNEIAKGVFDKIISKSANSWDMLQLADVCATTTFLSHEINKWGFHIPCYFNILQNHLYKHGDRILSYGLKYFTDETEEIMIDCPCKAKERTSGATSTD